MTSPLLKSLMLRALAAPAVLAWRREIIARAEAMTVLNLHRVAEPDGSAYRPLAPRLFIELLEYARKHFELVSFSELTNTRKFSRPPLILSFDDGYKDFIDVVVPILDKYQVRANQNVIPKCVHSGRPPLNVALQDFVGRAPASLVRKLRVPGFVIPKRLEDRTSLGLRLSAHVKNRPMADQSQLELELSGALPEFTDFRPTPMMTLDEIREVASLHDIGAHSYEHASLGFESDAYFVEDLKRCRAFLETEVGLAARIYAFPNGSYRQPQPELARRAGFEHVLLVNEQFSSASAHVHARLTLHGDSMRELLYRIHGGLALAGSSPKTR